MHNRTSLLCSFLLLACSAAAQAAQVTPAAPAAVLASVPCEDIKATPAVCLRATVPENHAQPDGRKIMLDVVVLKAASPTSLEPIYILEGGPGQRTTEQVDGEAAMWAQLRKHRDLVFIDQRGTGTTPDLHCTPADEEDDHPLQDLWPARSLRNCAIRLARSADLAHYATTDAARDLDAVRAALGHERIDLLAYSYGTRLAQEYVRRHGRFVRAQVLLGPEAPGDFVPAGMAQHEERSLEQVIERCRLDAQCRRHYPRFADDVESLKSPAGLAGTPPGTVANEKPSAGMIASYLRYRLYSAQGSVTLPKLFRELNDPATQPQKLAELTQWRTQFAAAAPWGMYMSVVCNEDIPFVDLAHERTAARGTLLGAYRIDQQADACRDWPRHAIPPDFHMPLSSDVPSLLIVGELDPATPPDDSRRILAGLTKSILVVVPNRSHLAIGEEDQCMKDVVERFVDDAVPVAPAPACLNELAFPQFETEPTWLEKLLDRARALFA
jgi:pimeloyl-ACP methyl ester carboxylesterase